MSENKQKNGVYYSASTVMRNVPEIMGLELTQKGLRNGYQWVGPYRLSGERCGHRRDKLKVFAWKGSVWVQEEGEPLVSIQRWLVEYGGCADYSQAGRLLRCADPAARIRECVINVKARAAEGRYVSPQQWEEYVARGLDGCLLYEWMCRLFGKDAAADAFGYYGITSNERGEAVYWYVDVECNICHDKVIAYKWDGHRDKSRGGWRRFTTSDGYTNRCYYGSHLIGRADAQGEETGQGVRRLVMVVEGEKTAVMCSIVWPEYVWIATGGKNQLRDVEKGWTLLPDVDAADEWSTRGAVSRWWEAYSERGEHSDIGDMVEAYAKAGRLEELKTDEMREFLFNNIR